MDKETNKVKPVYVVISLSITLILAIAGIKSYISFQNQPGDEEGQSVVSTYQEITQEEAKEIMDSGSDFVILDVREDYEYEEGHIKDAILIPYEKINELAEEMLPDKSQEILVYCRSGRRSKIAAESLVNLGYTDVKEFGGIIDWPYEIVTETK